MEEELGPIGLGAFRINNFLKIKNMAITIIILSILVAYLFSVIAIQSKTIKRLREDISLLEYENTHLKIQVDAKNKSKARNAKGDTSTSATGSTI